MHNIILLASVLGIANGKLETNPKIGAADFGSLFIECVEQTLTDLLGAKGREAVLDYLARNERLARGDIPRHARELSMLLGKTFGKGGIVIEKRIIKRLYALLEWEYKETSSFNFASQVNEAEARWKKSRMQK